MPTRSFLRKNPPQAIFITEPKTCSEPRHSRPGSPFGSARTFPPQGNKILSPGKPSNNLHHPVSHYRCRHSPPHRTPSTLTKRAIQTLIYVDSAQTVRIGVPTPDFSTAPHASSHRGADGDAVEKSLEGMAPSGSLSAHTPCAPCGYSRSAPTRGDEHDTSQKSASGGSSGQLKDQEEKASTGQCRSTATTGSDEKLKLIRELS